MITTGIDYDSGKNDLLSLHHYFVSLVHRGYISTDSITFIDKHITDCKLEPLYLENCSFYGVKS